MPVVSAAADTVTVSGAMGGGGIAAGRLLQYQAVTGPVLVPPAEALTLDKWAPHYPDRLARARAASEGAAVGPAFVPDVTTPAPPLSWAPRYPDALAGRRRPLSEGVAPVLVATPPTVDQPVASFPDRVLALARAVPGGATAPLFVPDVTDPAPLLSWAPRYPDRLPRLPRPPSGAVAPVQAPAAPVVAPDLAAPVYPDAVRRASGRALAPAATAPLFVPDVTTPAPLLSWAPRYPDRVPRRAVLPIGAWAAPVAAPVPLLSWAPVLAKPARPPARDRVIVAAPVLVPAVAVPLSWAPRYPDRVPRRVLPRLAAWVGPVAPAGSGAPIPTCLHVTVTASWPRVAVVGAWPHVTPAATWPRVSVTMTAPSVDGMATWPRVTVEGC